MRITGEVRLDGGNYHELAFRTPLIRQNRICRTIGETNSLKNGEILYNRVDREDDVGYVGTYSISAAERPGRTMTLVKL
jgi:hypothetical protein